MLAFTNPVETKERAVARASELSVTMDYFYDTPGGEHVRDEHFRYLMAPFIEEDEWWTSAAERIHLIPQSLSFVQMEIFNGLQNEAARDWTERYLNAIPVGSDLSLVIPRFFYWLLTDPEGFARYADAQGGRVIDRFTKLIARGLSGERLTSGMWNDVIDQSGRAAWKSWESGNAADGDMRPADAIAGALAIARFFLVERQTAEIFTGNENDPRFKTARERVGSAAGEATERIIGVIGTSEETIVRLSDKLVEFLEKP